jgi:hypothetical protein
LGLSSCFGKKSAKCKKCLLTDSEKKRVGGITKIFLTNSVFQQKECDDIFEWNILEQQILNLVFLQTTVLFLFIAMICLANLSIVSGRQKLFF